MQRLSRSFAEIIQPVSESVACHERCERLFIKLYEKLTFEEFAKEFYIVINYICVRPVLPQTNSEDRLLTFLSSFLTTLQVKYEKTILEENVSTVAVHPLLERVIDDTLELNSYGQFGGIYWTCRFIRFLLNKIANNFQLNEDICDKIQTRLLDCVDDIKTSIRNEALLALNRLQDPSVADCPVIKAFITRLNDNRSKIRRIAVMHIAPNPGTILKVIERTKDVDAQVRAAAFLKCSQFGPKFIKIEDRQSILINGFCEYDSKTQKVFFDVLIPKWLSMYEGNCLTLLNAVKLDADENDMEKTMAIFEKLCPILFKKLTIHQLIENLQLGDDKLIPINKLTIEHAAFWGNLYKYLNETDGLEDYTEEIFPELTSYCIFVRNYIKSRSHRVREWWEKVEWEEIISELFRMMQYCDFTDEVGRQTAVSLIEDVLATCKLDDKVILEILKILYFILNDTNELISKVSNIITQVREAEVQHPIRPDNSQKQKEHNFQIAQLQVQLFTLIHQQDEAKDKNDVVTVTELQTKIDELKEDIKIKNLPPEPQQEVTRKANNDPETLCKCMDILCALLQVPSIVTVNPFLQMLKEEYLDQYMHTRETEIKIRIMKICCLFSLIDKEIAKENIKYIISPILVYRITNVYIKGVVQVAVAGASDILLIHGPDVFPNDCSINQSSVSSKKKSGRRLYQQCDAMEVTSASDLSLENLIDLILDIFDDASDDLRETAGNALANLIENRIILSVSLITRLILKYLNPLTEKETPRICQRFGMAFIELAKTKHVDILQQAIIPVLETIANAPKKSPLDDINIDRTVMIFSDILNFDNSPLSNAHKNLQYAILSKLANFPHEKCVLHLTKQLAALSVPPEPETAKELKGMLEPILLDVKDKAPLRYLKKYGEKIEKVLHADAIGDVTAESRPSGSNSDVLSSVRSSYRPSESFSSKRKSSTTKQTKRKAASETTSIDRDASTTSVRKLATINETDIDGIEGSALQEGVGDSKSPSSNINETGDVSERLEETVDGKEPETQTTNNKKENATEESETRKRTLPENEEYPKKKRKQENNKDEKRNEPEPTQKETGSSNTAPLKTTRTNDKSNKSPTFKVPRVDTGSSIRKSMRKSILPKTPKAILQIKSPVLRQLTDRNSSKKQSTTISPKTKNKSNSKETEAKPSARRSLYSSLNTKSTKNGKKEGHQDNKDIHTQQNKKDENNTKSKNGKDINKRENNIIDGENKEDKRSLRVTKKLNSESPKQEKKRAQNEERGSSPKPENVSKLSRVKQNRHLLRTKEVEEVKTDKGNTDNESDGNKGKKKNNKNVVKDVTNEQTKSTTNKDIKNKNEKNSTVGELIDDTLRKNVDNKNEKNKRQAEINRGKESCHSSRSNESSIVTPQKKANKNNSNKMDLGSNDAKSEEKVRRVSNRLSESIRVSTHKSYKKNENVVEVTKENQCRRSVRLNESLIVTPEKTSNQNPRNKINKGTKNIEKNGQRDPRLSDQLHESICVTPQKNNRNEKNSLKRDDSGIFHKSVDRTQNKNKENTIQKTTENKNKQTQKDNLNIHHKNSLLSEKKAKPTEKKEKNKNASQDKKENKKIPPKRKNNEKTDTSSKIVKKKKVETNKTSNKTIENAGEPNRRSGRISINKSADTENPSNTKSPKRTKKKEESQDEQNIKESKQKTTQKCVNKSDIKKKGKPFSADKENLKTLNNPDIESSTPSSKRKTKILSVNNLRVSPRVKKPTKIIESMRNVLPSFMEKMASSSPKIIIKRNRNLEESLKLVKRSKRTLFHSKTK